jgi:hypothetical protein
LNVLDDHPTGQLPKYEALSYCWGDPADNVRITVDGVDIDVTRNLESALRHLRRSMTPRRLWVDAVCINQLDNAERAVQVSRMSQIYAQASCVLIWLGPASENSELALQTLLSLGSVTGSMVVQDLYKGHHITKAVWIRPRYRSQLRDLSTLSADEQQALIDLFSLRKWWNRRWIIQETANADRAFLVCGYRMLDWDVLSNIFRLNRSCRAGTFLMNVAKNAYLLEGIRYSAQEPHREVGIRRIGVTLRSMLYEMEDFECSEPRDWIFCLAGLPDVPPGSVEVDYNRSVRQVFVEATRTMIFNIDNEGDRRCPNMNVVCSAYRDRSSMLDLPSWVPDFSIACHNWLFDLSERNNQIYSASKQKPFLDELAFLENDTLECTCLVFDEIQRVVPFQLWENAETTAGGPTEIDVSANPEVDALLSSIYEWFIAMKASSSVSTLLQNAQETIKINYQATMSNKDSNWQDLLLNWLALAVSEQREVLGWLPRRLLEYDLPFDFRSRW